MSQLKKTRYLYLLATLTWLIAIVLIVTRPVDFYLGLFAGFGLILILLTMITNRKRDFVALDACQTVLEYGNQSGRPRGLKWIHCEMNGEIMTVSQYVLMPCQIEFEPIPGSEMEGIEAATIPRPVVAIFEWKQNSWQVARPIIFNLSLQETAKQLAISNNQ